MSDGKSTTYRQEFLVCPWCGEESGCRVDHLYDMKAFSGAFGPWHCEHCKRGIEGRVRSPGDVKVWRSKLQRSFSRSMALLKFDGKDGPVFFVMDHDRYHGEDSETQTDEDNQAHQKYFFEEHSCPTNWLRDCVAVIAAGDCDPHGFLTFVRAVDVPNDFDAEDDSNWSVLFPEAFGAPVIDGDTSE